MLLHVAEQTSAARILTGNGRAPSMALLPDQDLAGMGPSCICSYLLSLEGGSLGAPPTSNPHQGSVTPPAPQGELCSVIWSGLSSCTPAAPGQLGQAALHLSRLRRQRQLRRCGKKPTGKTRMSQQQPEGERLGRHYHAYG